MKQIFFTGVILTIPLLIAGGFLYMLGHGIVSLISDWHLNRELARLRAETESRRRQSGGTSATKELSSQELIERILQSESQDT